MPRPGPRPYECVRRAWHSDRHLPMRGSIIQQIFRVVNEIHGPGTKKNKEWQEKLPMVVLKAEEIMYSKANSEAEYMNLETLWDRANEAVNTIIRRDEGTETGELLPPCVEAALNLGCIPVKASRSQRHSNPRSYLTPRAQEPTSVPPRISGTTDERRPQFSSPHQSGNQLNFARPSTVNSAHSVPESYSRISQSTNLTSPRNYPFSIENVPAAHNQLTTMPTNKPLDLGSVYPLYYGTQCQSNECQAGSQVPENSHSRTIYVGTPIVTSILEPTKQNIFSSQNAENMSHRITQVMDNQEMPREAEFDLSLRLGPVLHPCTERSLADETEDIGSSNSQEGRKLNDFSPSITMPSKEICFFPTKTAYDHFESTSSMWNLEGEGRSLVPTVRKRKAPFSSNKEDGQFCWQSDVLPNRFSGRTTRPGL